MTDADRKIDAFRLLYNGVALPFGGVLGALLANVTGGYIAGPDRHVSFGAAAEFGFCVLGLLAFFVAIPVACEAIIRRRVPQGRTLVVGIVATLVWCAAIMPAQAFGIPYPLWLATATAWLLCCLTLCWMCHSTDMKKSMLR